MSERKTNFWDVLKDFGPDGCFMVLVAIAIAASAILMNLKLP